MKTQEPTRMRSGLMVSGCRTEDIFRKLRPCTFGFMAMRCLELVLTAPYQRVRPQVAGQLFYNAMMPMVRKFPNPPARRAQFFLGILSSFPKPAVSLFHPTAKSALLLTWWGQGHGNRKFIDLLKTIVMDKTQVGYFRCNTKHDSFKALSPWPFCHQGPADFWSCWQYYCHFYPKVSCKYF